MARRELSGGAEVTFDLLVKGPQESAKPSSGPAAWEVLFLKVFLDYLNELVDSHTRHQER